MENWTVKLPVAPVPNYVKSQSLQESTLHRQLTASTIHIKIKCSSFVLSTLLDIIMECVLAKSKYVLLFYPWLWFYEQIFNVHLDELMAKLSIIPNNGTANIVVTLIF